jgi:hypothetical protein
LTTTKLADGNHALTATATTSGGTSGASSALAVTIDTHEPNAPTEALYSQTGSKVGATTTLDDFVLKGSAEANSTIKVFDGTALLGTTTVNASGIWSLDTGHLASGIQSFTSTATDPAGNTSLVSVAMRVDITSSANGAGGISFSNLSENYWDSATIKGYADPNSVIKLYDGNKALGSTSVNSDGTWSFTTKPDLSNGLHSFTAAEVDNAGHVVAASSGVAMLSSGSADTLVSTSGDDFLVGKGHSDTFVFAPNFGNDVIKNFDAVGKNHDVVQFDKSIFSSFADVLAHASQVGQNVVITAGTDKVTLTNTQLGALSSHDFNFKG